MPSKAKKKNIENLFEIYDFDYLNQDYIGKDVLSIELDENNIEIKEKVQYLKYFFKVLEILIRSN